MPGRKKQPGGPKANVPAIDIPFRSGCPIASGLELIGDRWTLVIVRDLAMGKKRFGDFLDSPEHIATNTLASRLQEMESNGLVEARLYRQKPPRYEWRLTRRGAELIPVAQALARWGCATLPERWTPPPRFFALKPEDAPAF